MPISCCFLHVFFLLCPNKVRELTNRVQGVMPRELEQQTERLQRLQEELFEPQRSKDDVEAMKVHFKRHYCSVFHAR